MMEQWNRGGGTVKRDGGTVEQRTFNIRSSGDGTVEYLMVEEWNI